MTKNNDYRIVAAMIDSPLNDDGSYAGDGYQMVSELIKSFTIDQLQDLHLRMDDFKMDLEKLILSRL